MNQNLEVVNANDPDYPDDIVVQDAPQSDVVPTGLMEAGHFDNLAEFFSDADLDELGNYITERVQNDLDSRREWGKQLVRSMQLLGLGDNSKPDDAEYEDADTSEHPLLLQALVRFQAQALNEMLPPEQVCSAESAMDLSDVPPEKRTAFEEQMDEICKRVQDFVSEYLLERLGTYSSDHDRTLYDTGLAGSGFKKVFLDSGLPDPCRVEQVSSEDLIISYDAVSMQVGRITHRISSPASDMIRLMETGVYREVRIDKAESDDEVTKERDKTQGLVAPQLSARDNYQLYETHAELVLDQDVNPKRLPRPYVVTVDSESSKVLAIRRNWKEADPFERRIEAFISYMFHPGKSSIYGLGLGQILANTTEALRTAQRHALEAAYLANHPVGLKKAGLTIRDSSSKLVPGEWLDVDAPTEKIGDSFAIFPFKGPDPGLITLIENMQNNGKELGGTTTMNIGELLKQNTPVGTTLAALDENNKFMTAVHRRLYTAHKRELKLIHQALLAAFKGQEIEYGQGKKLRSGDLESVVLLPAMHPMYANRQRHIIQAEAALKAAERHPNIVKERAAVEAYFQAIGVDNPEGLLVPLPEDAKPADAMTEYGKALRGEPLKAGLAQAHEAHIEAHVAQLQLVQTSQLPVDAGQRVMGSLTAHIAEHTAMQLGIEVIMALGLPVEMLEQGIPPEVEAEIAPQVAQAMVMIAQSMQKPGETDLRLQIEQLKSQTQLRIQGMKDAAMLQKQKMTAEDVRMKEDASTFRNDEDNETALEIAEMQAVSRAGGTVPQKGLPKTNYPVTAPTQNQNPNPRGG